MYGKKQRIISFLIAFLLIFTFAFINPLTVSQSYAFVPAVPVLTASMGRIITGVLVSAGYIIHEGVTATDDYDKALQDMSRVIYQTLNGAQKIVLGALSIVDNIVEVPISLYDAIVNNANSIIRYSEIDTSLVGQGFGIRYCNIESSSTEYPTLSFPFYYNTEKYMIGTSGGWKTNDNKTLDLSEAQPFFIYEGLDNAENPNMIYPEGITYRYSDVFSSDIPIYEGSTIDENTIYLTPDMSSYDISYQNKTFTENPLLVEYLYNYSENNYTYYRYLYNDGRIVNIFDTDSVPSDINLNDCILKMYWIYDNYTSSGNKFIHTAVDIYDKTTGELLYQNCNYTTNTMNDSSSKNVYGIYDNIYKNIDTVSPFEYDITLVPESTTTVVPPVTNTVGNNVITLPSELSGTIGATSTDVNVGVTDVPETGEGTGTNTETMENINTNVGELVTGGTLGEQVNTNIGTVEGLHGELTEQVDFGAVFDTIAQYISSLDISSVTWFPTAVASFLVPFLPVISLGLILFFIDRVLNGGA